MNDQSGPYLLLPIQLILGLARFFLQQSIHPARLVLLGRLRNPLDADGDDLLAVLNHELVAGFDGAARFRFAAVDPDASLIGHILRDGAPLDQTAIL